MHISVIIPLYNKSPWVKRAIDSVLNQTIQDFELIVVDDGSTDDSAQVVEAIDDSRIRLLCQPNAGAAAARNTGILAAQAEWIAFLDADDEWLPHHLETFQGLIAKFPEVRWAGAAYAKQSPNGNWHTQPLRESYGTDDDLLIEDSLSTLSEKAFWTGSVFIHRCVFEEAGLFDTELKTAEDPDMWFRIAVKYPQMAFSRQIVAIYYDTPMSLMKLSDVQFKTSQHLLDKYLSAFKFLPVTRQLLAYKIVRSRVNLLIMSLVFSGQKDKAAQMCSRYKSSISLKKYIIYQLYLWIPLFILDTLLRIKLRFNRRVKKVNNPSSAETCK